MRDVSGSLEASPPRAEDISRNSTTNNRVKEISSHPAVEEIPVEEYE